MWKDAESWRCVVGCVAGLDMVISLASIFGFACAAVVVSFLLEIMFPDLPSDVYVSLFRPIIMWCPLFLVQTCVALRLLLATRKMETDLKRNLGCARMWQYFNAFQIFVMIAFRVKGLDLDLFIIIRLISSVLVQFFIREITKAIQGFA